jgi:hypothetical protein
MGEAGGFHQVRDADAVEAPLAEEPAGGVDDAVPILGGPLPTHSHRRAPILRKALDSLYDVRHLSSIMMMTVM